MLLRRARGSYARTIAALLSEEGFDDLPQNGPFLLGGMANHSAPAVELIRGLGVTRQAASQLIDTLVLRGYLTREVNQEDRRRMDVELTERGRAAAAVVRQAVVQVDRELTAALSTDQIAGLRAGLEVLGRIKEQAERQGRSHD